jgi:hypothetical protein
MSKGPQLIDFRDIELPRRSVCEMITLPIRLIGGAMQSGAGSYTSRPAINVAVEANPQSPDSTN